MDLFAKVNKDLGSVINEVLGDKIKDNPRLEASIKYVIPPVQTGCDYSTNVAMVFAKACGTNPIELSNIIADKIREIDYIKSVETTRGYINIIFNENIWDEFLCGINLEKSNFGNGDLEGNVLLEFISANPTGPLHVGHCRGAILGLALANLLKKAGYDVTKEYYINDYGVQIATLLKSIQFRYEQIYGKHVGESVPEGCYPGDYLVDYAKKLAIEYGDKFVGLTENDFYNQCKTISVNAMMDVIRADLKLLGLEFDSFVSETNIVNNGEIGKALDYLKTKTKRVVDEDGGEEDLSYIYKGVLDLPTGKSANEDENEESRCSSEPQTLFRSTLFGDDKDRVILRADGSSTYFASDIAYHKNKFDRGYSTMINLFGADHGGYVKRITSAVDAISEGKASLEVVLMQMVNLEKNGEPFKMSKRKGTFVMLSDVANTIDVDELKLFMLSKSADTQMTFDLVKVKEKSKDNLVYYIQYAYARTNSLLKNFQDKFGYQYNYNDIDLKGFTATAPKEIKEIMVFLAKYPNVIRNSAINRAPNMVVDYLKELSAMFHSLWGAGIKLVDLTNELYSKSMMAFVMSIQAVIENALICLGIEPKKKLVK